MSSDKAERHPKTKAIRASRANPRRRESSVRVETRMVRATSPRWRVTTCDAPGRWLEGGSVITRGHEAESARRGPARATRWTSWAPGSPQVASTGRPRRPLARVGRAGGEAAVRDPRPQVACVAGRAAARPTGQVSVPRRTSALNWPLEVELHAELEDVRVAAGAARLGIEVGHDVVGHDARVGVQVPVHAQGDVAELAAVR